MIGIYKITSPTGKIYIGQSIRIEIRFKTYKNSNNAKEQPALYNSFKKYGYENHIFEVVCECDAKELNEKERYYQELYDVLSINGLNCLYVKTNDKSGKLSNETKAKLSIALKGNGKGIQKSDNFKKMVSENNRKRIITKEQREAKSLFMKGKYVGNKNPFYGKKHTKESKAKISKNNKGKQSRLGILHTYESKEKMRVSASGKFGELNYNSKIILDVTNGVFYSCIKEVADLNNICRHNLARKIRGDRKNDTNYIFA